jgi:hypothetical protein
VVKRGKPECPYCKIKSGCPLHSPSLYWQLLLLCYVQVSEKALQWRANYWQHCYFVSLCSQA